MQGTKSPIAVYAGTFDPITNGHLDVVERALGIFERLIVAIGENPSKTALFSPAERMELIKGAVESFSDRVSVEMFGGLLVDFVRSRGARVIIRGLRAVSDYEYEAQMAIVNRQLGQDVETVFFMTSAHSSFISSSVVRNIAKAQGDVSSLVPPNVAQRLHQMFRGS